MENALKIIKNLCKIEKSKDIGESLREKYRKFHKLSDT